MSQHTLRNPADTATTVKCPECGDIIVYNGNFFCNGNGFPYSDKGKVFIAPSLCGWALPHPVIRKSDRAVAKELHAQGYMARLELS